MQFAPKNFHKKLLGKIGENKAVSFLKKKGYKLLEKNYKDYIGEADIIMKDGDVLVFVEVKNRTDDSYGEPCEAVDKRKQQKYFKLAQEYLIKKGLKDVQCRFDVVEIKNDKINHIFNAFSM